MTNLFPTHTEPTKNILPFDGEVYYNGRIYSTDEANHLLNILLKNIDWKPDELVMFGKQITTKREVAWYGDTGIEYTYSKRLKRALPWTAELLQLKAITETLANDKFNSCLLNLYHDGTESMGWHSDDEKELKPYGTIASLSFGAPRKFMFRHKQTKETISILLEHGSLLLMKGTVQQHWSHRLPPAKLVAQPRVNLTFRTII